MLFLTNLTLKGDCDNEVLGGDPPGDPPLAAALGGRGGHLLDHLGGEHQDDHGQDEAVQLQPPPHPAKQDKTALDKTWEEVIKVQLGIKSAACRQVRYTWNNKKLQQL